MSNKENKQKKENEMKQPTIDLLNAIQETLTPESTAAIACQLLSIQASNKDVEEDVKWLVEFLGFAKTMDQYNELIEDAGL